MSSEYVTKLIWHSHEDAMKCLGSCPTTAHPAARTIHVYPSTRAQVLGHPPDRVRVTHHSHDLSESCPGACTNTIHAIGSDGVVNVREVAGVPTSTILCSLCIYVREGRDINPADTVIGGYASCLDHAGYFQDSDISLAITRAQHAERTGEH